MNYVRVCLLSIEWFVWNVNHKASAKFLTIFSSNFLSFFFWLIFSYSYFLQFRLATRECADISDVLTLMKFSNSFFVLFFQFQSSVSVDERPKTLLFSPSSRGKIGTSWRIFNSMLCNVRDVQVIVIEIVPNFHQDHSIVRIQHEDVAVDALVGRDLEFKRRWRRTFFLHFLQSSSVLRLFFFFLDK